LYTTDIEASPRIIALADARETMSIAVSSPLALTSLLSFPLIAYNEKWYVLEPRERNKIKKKEKH
jgi:hypothetical protein